MTKREVYDVIEAVFNTIDNENKDDVLAMIAKERASLNRKNEKAKERAAEKKAAGDELRTRIEAILTDEPKTTNDIMTELGDENLTPSKITARMTQLYKNGVIEKHQVKIDGRKLVAYTLA